ncbi:MAG TPA: response regulator transcription factor, partial [Ktedonobacterales bacterium]|nr:response regulator transcription factor [Ktedonobacterales bacterium]
ARLRALLRRGGPRANGDEAASGQERSEPITVGDLRIDEDRREARRGDRLIELPPRLFDLLLYLARRPGAVQTRGRLLEHVWGYDYAGDTRTVDVHVRWLREKIEDDPANPQLIQTVRGVGYRLKG